MKELVQYIRDKNGNPVGTMVAQLRSGRVCFGVSMCNTSKDSFTKEMGKRIARGRIEELDPENYQLASEFPNHSLSDLESFEIRALKYFKGRFSNIDWTNCA